MSGASTWIALGYLPISARHGSCTNCSKASAAPDGLRCTLGHFYVNRMGGCRSFEPVIEVDAAATAQGTAAHVHGVRP